MHKNSFKCASHRLHLRKRNSFQATQKSMSILPKRNAFSFSPWQGQVLFCLHVVEMATIFEIPSKELNLILLHSVSNLNSPSKDQNSEQNI